MVACEPGLPLTIENRTSQALTIYVNGFQEFDVAPGRTVKKHTVPMIYGTYVIEARNAQGETIYSREFLLKELQECEL